MQQRLSSDAWGERELVGESPLKAPLERNLRIPAERVLDLLATLALHPEERVPIPEALQSSSTYPQSHVRLFLETLELAEIHKDGATVVALPRREQLREAWKANDRDSVFDLIRLWSPLDEVATMVRQSERPEKTLGSARRLAALLGQGHYLDGQWLPGGERPSSEEIRQILRDSVPNEPPRVISICTLLVDVFLRALRVSPVRAKQAWPTMWSEGVFAGFEPRTGGSSSGHYTQQVVRLGLGESGWDTERHDLETLGDYRELVWKGD